MIAWMTFSAVFALLLGLAARASESAVRPYGRPVRWIWLSAILTSAVMPVLIWLTGVRWPGLITWRRSLAPLTTDVGNLSRIDASWLTMSTDAGFPFDRAALLLWVMLSLAALCWFCWAWRRLSRARASWHPAQLGNQHVLLSKASGPAVIGLYRPSIVVPHWVLNETVSAQRLILLHEQEHARAGDHVLLACAPLLLVALPWNLPLWWQAKRLRLAIELDCDARVLRHGVCAREYGTLLLELASAHGTAAIGGASLVEPRTFLERRILAMSSRTTRYRYVRTALAGAATIMIGVAACESTTAMAPSREVKPEEEAAVTPTHTAEAHQGRGVLLIVDGQRIGRTDDQSYAAVLKRLEELYDSRHLAVGSVEIVKGAAAVERFGPDAANGVIVVTTKGEKLLPLDVEVVKKLHDAYELELRAENIKLDESYDVKYEPTAKLYIERKLTSQNVKIEAEPSMLTEQRKMMAEYVEVKKPGAAVELVAVAKPRYKEEALPVTVELKLEAEPERVKVSERGFFELPQDASLRPLLLIDGFEAQDGELRKLDPSRIESIEVLKGPAAAAKFGERARNGAILIQTKRDGL